MLLLYELVVYISVCLLAVTGGGRAAPAIAEVRLTFTPGPCSNDTLRWNRKTRMLEICNGIEWVGVSGCSKLKGSKSFPGASCKDIQQQGVEENGIYWIQPPGSNFPFQAYCDMQTDGGGWMLLYAYKHRKGTKYDLVTALPTSPDGYSHQLLNNMGISTGWTQELRFYCTTSHHNRVVHFKTNNRNIIQTAYDGKKHFSVSDCSSKQTEKLTGHTAHLPDATSHIWGGNHQTVGFTEFPFYRGGTYHWGIAPRYSRFECDDYANNYNYDTLHRVFVRD
ncbi:angiopoietin-2-like [Corticium candelabrum]|uniref:angiopoietin-2-like n=1 Tax=Corticium candelabrum TaxID=121492 RepID=UPI002E26C23F|nr:angiopoietin-2-like [Corticium candelabrum]